GDQARPLAAGIAAQRPVAEPHLATLGRQQSEQRLQQRGLAAAVRPQQRQHLSRRQRHVEMAADRPVAVADGEIVAREDHTAMSGTTRPAQPMMPAVATLADVTSVAAATMTMRSAPVGSPRARASSSGSDITFIRQRSASSTSVPSATGPNSGMRSATPVAA